MDDGDNGMAAGAELQVPSQEMVQWDNLEPVLPATAISPTNADFDSGACSQLISRLAPPGIALPQS